MNVVALAEITKSALAMMPNANKELPYEGAKEMLLVDNIDDREFLQDLVQTIAPELLEVRKKRAAISI